MFKHAIIYATNFGIDSASLDRIEEALDKGRFAPCGASQERSAGWIEPRGEAHGPLVESIDGQLIVKLQVESKTVPGALIKRKVEEAKQKVEDETGRKPGKKESRELRDDVVLSLLPMAFTKIRATTGWIDRDTKRLVISAGSQGQADEFVTRLIEALPGLSVAFIDTQVSPTAAMTEWLVSQDAPAGFQVDRECELRAQDESKAIVRYTRHPLDTDEVKEHIQQGKLPTKLAMTWDERVSFVLTNDMQLKKIVFLDGVFDGTTGKKEDGFDADVAIMTGEFKALIPDLFEALGGVVPPGQLRKAASIDANEDLF